MGLLDGESIVITGAAQGMGAEHATRCVAEGARVFLTDLQEKILDENIDRFRTMLDVNVDVIGTWLGVRALAPNIRDAGGGCTAT